MEMTYEEFEQSLYQDTWDEEQRLLRYDNNCNSKERERCLNLWVKLLFVIYDAGVDNEYEEYKRKCLGI